MNGVKNIRVLATGLCLSATLLTGCGDKIHYGTSTINYESETPEGTINYEDLSNFGKIVTLESNGIRKQLLLMVDKDNYDNSSYINITYKDLKTGTTIIKYKDSSNEKVWIVGENLTIVEEQDVTGYLLQEDFIKREYEVSEVLTFFEEKIKPTLGSSEKELVK